MNPPYDITPVILRLLTAISEQLGLVKATYMNKPEPQLRKQNRIKTIQASLNIEGNTLNEEQITALIENKRIIGPQKDILEVLNAIKVYDNLQKYNPYSLKSFLAGHQLLMKGLIKHAGKLRSTGVGIVKGKEVTHLAPPAGNLRFLMNNLFKNLKNKDELTLIKSCVFHYEIEFIHPFLDGNGRMGRLWQTLILMQDHPVFEYLPFETLISQTQGAYYKALADSDKEGKSTRFIEYMLGVIEATLTQLLKFNNRTLSDDDRLAYFLSLEQKSFSRKDYMAVFKDISSATASRDLKNGVETGIIKKTGEKNKTIYSLA